MALPHQQPSEPTRDAEKVQLAVSAFGMELLPRMRGDGRPEDRLRAPVYSLLKKIGGILGRDIVVHDEVPVSEISSRPDFAVDTKSGRVGYVELKSLEKGIPEDWHPTRHDRDQLKRLSALPNLIYTNGASWALYRNGNLIGRVANLDGNLYRSGEKLKPRDTELELLLRNFLTWKPSQPSSIRAVVSDVAPLCRLLREQVIEVMLEEKSRPGKRPFTKLANEWRNLLFPTLEAKNFETQFVDAYAQTVTFAMLLARVDGVIFDGRSLGEIAEQLSKQHSLIGEALSILTKPRWVKKLSVVDTLQRVIGNINWERVHLGESDAYTLMYETFLSEYDPKLRQESGTYYTPDPVARAMVRFTDSVLKTRIGKQRGFAADDVIVVDPAMGTGTFLVEIIDNVVSTLQKERKSDTIPKAHLRELFAKRLVGFELQAAPYAVAELRLHHILKNIYGIDLPDEEVRFLCNTLDDPDTLPLDLGQLYDVLKESRDGANRIKRKTPVMVVIGNPPWRERAKGEAPWIESRRDPKILQSDSWSRPSLDEFRAPGQGRLAFNLSNMWTYFWRWSTWKVFDANSDHPAGVVALITPKAYVTSDAYRGMRRYLRETADEGWIIDVTPEEHRSSSQYRIFPKVQQTICIGVFARFGKPDRKTPARVHHTVITGTQKEKFDKLLGLNLTTTPWKECQNGWESAFQAIGQNWISYVKLSDIFPWQHSGVNSNRNWVWSPDVQTLQVRWSTLIHSNEREMPGLFKETRDRTIERSFPTLHGVPSSDLPIAKENNENLSTVAVAFRSFDRQHLIFDRRVIDFPRPELWQVASEEQIYISEQHAHPITDGPGLLFSALVPNVHHFNGRGGRVLPLYRDPTGTAPNVAPKLMESIGHFIGTRVSPKDIASYIAAVVAHPAYTKKFMVQLETPGIRVPLSMDRELWERAIKVGREVIWLHTYGERFCDDADNRPRGNPMLPIEQRPRYTESVSTNEIQMPQFIDYLPASETLIIGEDSLIETAGRIEGVTSAMWNYRVGGVQVIPKWFSYRQRTPNKKKHTSNLDNINASHWTARFDDELLALLNVVGRCIALEQRQASLLEEICAGPLITPADLEREAVFPVSDAARKPPHRPQAGTLLDIDPS